MPRKLSALPFPRQIKPELVELGDAIEVILPKAAGMTITRRGVVSALGRHNGVRQLLTSEAGVLCAWEPGVYTGVIIMLHYRPDAPQPSLFDFTVGMDEVRERIA